MLYLTTQQTPTTISDAGEADEGFEKGDGDDGSVGGFEGDERSEGLIGCWRGAEEEDEDPHGDGWGEEEEGGSGDWSGN